jgi:hypothetical protein
MKQRDDLASFRILAGDIGPLRWFNVDVTPAYRQGRRHALR